MIFNLVKRIKKINPMKIKNTKLLLFMMMTVAVLSLTLITGCKKEEDENSVSCTNGIIDENENGVDCGGVCSPCNLSQYRIRMRRIIRGSNIDEIEYTYDNKGRTINSGSGSSLRFYTYYADSVKLVTNSGYKVYYALNSMGYTSSYKNIDPSNNITSIGYCTYDADGHLVFDSRTNNSYCME